MVAPAPRVACGAPGLTSGQQQREPCRREQHSSPGCAPQAAHRARTPPGLQLRPAPAATPHGPGLLRLLAGLAQSCESEGRSSGTQQIESCVAGGSPCGTRPAVPRGPGRCSVASTPGVQVRQQPGCTFHPALPQQVQEIWDQGAQVCHRSRQVACTQALQVSSASVQSAPDTAALDQALQLETPCDLAWEGVRSDPYRPLIQAAVTPDRAPPAGGRSAAGAADAAGAGSSAAPMMAGHQPWAAGSPRPPGWPWLCSPSRHTWAPCTPELLGRCPDSWLRVHILLCCGRACRPKAWHSHAIPLLCSKSQVCSCQGAAGAGTPHAARAIRSAGSPLEHGRRCETRTCCQLPADGA